MQLEFKNTSLDIFVDNVLLDYDINKDIDKLRIEFNNVISELSSKYHSIEYWTMRLSERNSLAHSLFLDICKINLIESLKTTQKNIKISTNNASIYLYFRDAAKTDIKSIAIFNLKVFTRGYKPFLQMLKFSIAKFLFYIKYVDKSKALDLSRHVVIQTWISDSNFKNGAFKDSYYGDLAEYLKKNDKKVITCPVFYNVKDQNKAVSFIRKHSEDFFIIEDYLKFSDYLFAVKLFFKKRFLKFGTINILKKDFTKVFKYYQNQECVEETSLFYSFAKRLKEYNIDDITFMHNHENMIAEKALIIGAREYLPNSVLIGYFHTTKPKNQLCLEYASEEEYKIAPKPDKIVFNSHKYKEYYEKKYSDIPMYDGAAFKQLHLRNKFQNQEISSDKVLVLFSGTNHEVVLMFNLLNSLNNEYEFIFRMHPMNRFDVKKYYARNNYKIENEMSLDELMSSVNKVISTYSAVAVESALSGLNVGLVYNKKELLINPFDDTGIDNYQLIADYIELENFLDDQCNKKDITQIFNIDDEYYKTFVEII